MMHAVVLIKAERAAIADLGGRLADVSGISEAYSVTGEWDFVAIIRVRDAEEVAQTVTVGLAEIPGVVDTLTLVAFRVFSQHDLEAMFSIGR